MSRLELKLHPLSIYTTFQLVVVTTLPVTDKHNCGGRHIAAEMTQQRKVIASVVDVFASRH